LLALGVFLNQPPTKLNTYELWAVERVGVLYNLPTIGNVPWYRWGVMILLPTQRLDGSWYGHGYSGSSPPLDTAMALLFLKRANLTPDLTTSLRRYVVVADPALALLPKGQPPVPQPLDVWLLTENPDEAPLRVPLTTGIAPQAKEPVTVTLGDAKTGTQTVRTLTVRCAIPFRITGIKGTDKECGAEADNHESKTEHVLTIRLQPNEAGELTRSLRLLTDLPNGGVIEFSTKAQAVKER
jgi:hypothetical protein